MQPGREPSSPHRSSLWQLFVLGVLAVFSWKRSKRKSAIQPTRSSIAPSTKIFDKGEQDPQVLALASPQLSPSPSTAEQPCKCCHHKTPWWRIILDWATFAVGVATLVAVIYYTQAAYRQLGEMHKAAEAATGANAIANTTLEISQRPWMVEQFAISSPVEFAPSGEMIIHILSHMKNIGRSVAMDVKLHMAGFPEEFGNFDRAVKEQREMCEMFRTLPEPPGMPSNGELVFPDQVSQTVNNQLTFPNTEIAKAISRPNPEHPKGPITGIVIYGCIDYKFAFSSTHHQTGFAYEIYRPSQEAIGTLSIMVGENLPASQLAMRPYMFGGRYAD